MRRIWEFIVDFLAINTGMAVYALGWAAFLLPYHITTGGMTGMFAILYYVTGFPVQYAILIANSILLLFAVWLLGWKFTIKTAYVNKYRNISFGRALLILDFLVIASCWPIFHDVRMVVFGYVTLVVYTYALDLLINSTRQDIQFIIFTHKPDEISQRIITETCHSVTLMNGEGFYSHQEIKVLITIVHKRESVKILRMIQETDPAAFVSQSRAEGVYGNGFKSIRA